MADITQTCRKTGKQFVVTDWEQEFLKSFDMPLPTLCIEERHKRRLTHRNERKIYRDTCDLTGKSIISMYAEDSPYTVYSQEAWWGDKWNAKDYGRDYDFSRPFFEQYNDLRLSVPRLSLMNTNAYNSEFCNVTTDNKNCYLVFGGDYNEDAMYSIFCFKSRDISDVYWVVESELVYECIDSHRCYNVKYARNSQGCSDSTFLYECKGCKNCLGCVGLVNKEYHIFNKKYSKEEYEKMLKEYRLDSWSGVEAFRREFEEFKLQFPVRDTDLINCENVRGDRLRNVKNCYNCFDIDGPAEDCRDVFLAGWNLKDSYSSCMAGHKAEQYYEMLGSIGSMHCAMGLFIWHSHDVYYSDMVVNSHDCFGCSNMQRAEYCILNKQYSKDEYFEMLARIKEHMRSTGEWGEFFPMKASCFAYNETVAVDYFPMTKDEVLDAGLRWRDEEMRTPGSGALIPDSIHDVTDEILKESLVCEKTGRPYKIIPKELEFYRKMEIPVPRLAPETRNEVRFRVRNPIRGWDRNCAKCGKEIFTSYSPERPEKVYCEACYMTELY